MWFPPWYDPSFWKEWDARHHIEGGHSDPVCCSLGFVEVINGNGEVDHFPIVFESFNHCVFTHADFINEKYEDFWSLTAGIPLAQFRKTTYKPNRHGAYKKNPIYKGCVRIEIDGEGMALLRKTICLYETFISEVEMLYSQG